MFGAVNFGDGSSGDVQEPRRRLAAIMFTDIVGFSALAQENEAAALAALDRHNRLLRPIFSRFSGREVKTVGDAFLVEFESALDAVRCALEIQQTLHDAESAGGATPRIEIRIGVHVGDVVQSAGDVLGDAVNVTARIAPLAEPGGICLTQQVYDQVRNKLPAPMVQLPPMALKNIRLPVVVYRIVQAWEGASGEGRGPGSAGGRSLAVLPLANISPDPGDAYFADGLTEELISVLSQVQDLGVIARTSVVPYKNAQKTIAQVGSELGVESVLEGSVRKAGNRLRISLQLIDVATQRHIWTGTYNREIDDVFAVQADIASQTADALRLRLVHPGAPSDRRPTANPAAYDAYLRGLVAMQERGGQGIEEAVRCFEKATQLDPTFAEAFAAWAELYVIVAGDYRPRREVMPRARELAARALELDPELSDAHSALANIAMQFDHDWRRAEEEYRRALALNPSNVEAYRFLGMLLVTQDRFDEARELFQRAIRLDPGGASQLHSLKWVDLESGHYETAVRATREECERGPSSVGDHVSHALCYLQAGLVEEARREAERPTDGATDVERFDHAIVDALVGHLERARETLREAETGRLSTYISPADLALLYAALGEQDRALDLLEKDYTEGDGILWLYYRGLYFDPIRNNPRFVALLEKYGVPTRPPRRGALGSPSPARPA